MILLTVGLLLVFISGLLLGKQFGPRFCAAYEKGYARGYGAALDDYPPGDYADGYVQGCLDEGAERNRMEHDE